MNKRVNPNSILPCKKKQKTKNKQTFAQIIWCVTKRFQMLSQDNFKIVTYPIVPSGHHNRSQCVSLLVLLEGKALIRPLMINKILCQLELLWSSISDLGQQKTVPNYHVKCHERFLYSFSRIHVYLKREIYLGKARSHALTKFPAVKESFFTTVKVSRVTAPNILHIYTIVSFCCVKFIVLLCKC